VSISSLARYRKALVDFVELVGDSVRPEGRLHVA
jgi:hypothetical protein